MIDNFIFLHNQTSRFITNKPIGDEKDLYSPIRIRVFAVF